MSIFDIQSTAFEFAGYPVSVIELAGTIFGLISVFLASRTNILTWPTGIVNEFFLFLLFYQLQLYADMFLQVYFFAVTLYGWYFWKQGKHREEITRMSPRIRILLAITLLPLTLICGFLISRLHQLLPAFFSNPASYPYSDSFVMVGSIVATMLLARKKIETWYLWIAVDLTCVGIYFQKGTLFLALEYLIFLFLAAYGLRNWKLAASHG